MTNSDVFKTFGQTVRRIREATSETGGRWVKLGDGSYTGTIIDEANAQAGAVHWHLLVDDGTGTIQEKGTALLSAQFDYLYEDDPAFDGKDIKIAFPPGNSRESGSYYVVEIDRTSTAEQYGKKPLGKQAIDAAGQPSVSQVSTLRATLNSDLTVTVGDPDEKYVYPAAVTLAETVFTVDTVDIAPAVADLSGTDNHQLCLVCLDKRTNTITYLLSVPQPHSAPLPAREELTDDDIADFDLLNHPSYEPVIVTYIYDGQGQFVDEDEIQIEVRTFFPPVGAYLAIKHKWDATVAPTSGDDSDDGYSIGSRWLNLSSDKEYVCFDATATAAIWKETTDSSGGGGSSTNYIQIQDQKAANTHGGTFSSGAWRTRDLNTIVHDDTGAVTLSSNQFTLPAGTYRIRAWGHAWGVGSHQLALYNVTDSAFVAGVYGEAAYVNSSSATGSASHLSGRFTIAGSKTFEIQHQCETTQATLGYGVGRSWMTTEVFCNVELEKE